MWTPKYRFRILSGYISSQLSRDIHALSLMKDVFVKELKIHGAHIHMLSSIPAKLSISGLKGFLKGKKVIK
ncbi:MAG: transposase [Bacteroidota bacterium]